MIRVTSAASPDLFLRPSSPAAPRRARQPVRVRACTPLPRRRGRRPCLFVGRGCRKADLAGGVHAAPLADLGCQVEGFDARAGRVRGSLFAREHPHDLEFVAVWVGVVDALGRAPMAGFSGVRAASAETPRWPEALRTAAGGDRGCHQPQYEVAVQGAVRRAESADPAPRLVNGGVKRSLRECRLCGPWRGAVSRRHGRRSCRGRGRWRGWPARRRPGARRRRRTGPGSSRAPWFCAGEYEDTGGSEPGLGGG